MPVEPTEKNFKQFEKENPGIKLNVYSTAEEAEKSPIKPLYIGTNRSLKIINLLYHKNEEGKAHYGFIKNMSRVIHQATRHGGKKFVCPYCACVYFHSQEAFSNHLETKHPYLDNDFVCEKCLNTFHTYEALQFHQMVCMVKDREARKIEYPAYERPIRWDENNNYMLNRISTWIVADFESILLKESAIKGANSKIIHKHQPCAWGLTVMTERKGNKI